MVVATICAGPAGRSLTSETPLSWCPGSLPCLAGAQGETRVSMVMSLCTQSSCLRGHEVFESTVLCGNGGGAFPSGLALLSQGLNKRTRQESVNTLGRETDHSVGRLRGEERDPVLVCGCFSVPFSHAPSLPLYK